MKKYPLSISLFLMLILPTAVFAAEDAKSYNPPNWVPFLMISLGVIACGILMASMRQKKNDEHHH